LLAQRFLWRNMKPELPQSNTEYSYTGGLLWESNQPQRS